MRVGIAAQSLGVDPKTINNWVDNELLAPYFSPSARGENTGRRDFTDDDLLTLNTIRVERSKMSSKDTDWQVIADVLGAGRRDRQMPPQAMTVDTGMSMIAQTERMVSTINDRDAALRRVDELEAERRDLLARLERLEAARIADVERLEAGRRADLERLLREQADLRARIATLEAQQGKDAG